MPVVNPMVFYWMSVCDMLSLWTLLISLLLLVVGGACLGSCVGEDIHSTYEKVFKIGKRALIVAAILLSVRIFIPNQTTCEKMLIAQNVTYERVEQATDTVTDVYNDIMNLFRESKADE